MPKNYGIFASGFDNTKKKNAWIKFKKIEGEDEDNKQILRAKQIQQLQYLDITKISDMMKYLLVLTVLCVFGSGREIQVPAIHDYNPISAKMGTYKIVQQPNFDFDKVYHRSVMKIDGGSTYRYAPCSENKPEVEFNVKDQILFKGIPEKPVVIYNFEDIRYSQFLLDLYYEDLNIYIMFKNGKVAVVSLQNNDRIDSTKMIDVLGLPPNTNLEVGYFIKVGDDLLFVNNYVTIYVGSEQAQVIQGYEQYSDFQSVIALDNNYFAVVNSSTGIVVYSYDAKNGTVSKINQFRGETLLPPGSVNQLQIVDFTYYKNKNILIVVDYVNGIQSYELSYNDKGVSLKASNTISKTYGCKVAYLYNTTLYVSCARMYAYELEQWPTISQKHLPFPNIEVREIYEVGDLVAFVGRDAFTMLYLDRVVNYFQDGNLDKLVFAGNLYISANEGGLDIGEVDIILPYISCYNDQSDFLGVSQLVFKTTAECNDTYFQQYQVNKSALGEIGPQDVCIYTVYRSMNYWQVGEIKTYPFIGAIIGIGVVIIIAILVFLVKNLKINRIKQMVEQYSTQNTNSQSAKHYELAEQMDGGVSNAQKQKEEDEKKGATNEQLGENMHQI